MFRPMFTILALSLSTSALAAQPYVGVLAGSAKVRASDIDETVVYNSSPAAPGDNTPLFTDDVFSARYKRAVDVGVVGGFDFGWFRVEGELSHKRAKIDHYVTDDSAAQFLGDLNSGLNRPSQAPDPGAPGLAALTVSDFQPSTTIKAGAVMVNAMLDVPVVKGFSVYIGAGVGRSFVSGFGDSDGALARQRMVGAHYSIGDRVEIGLRYRKFASGIIKLEHDPIAYSGNPNQVTGSGAPFNRTTNALVTPDLEGEFRTPSWLLSLTYNL